MNRRFDELFPTYEISYMDPSWDFIINDTKYVVVPGIGLPRQLTNFKNCIYIFYRQVGPESIFRVNCGINK